MTRGTSTRLGPPLLALIGRWRPSRQGQVRSRVATGAQGWCWAAALGDGSVTAAAFIDPRTVSLGRQDRVRAYARLVGSTLQERPEQHELIGPVIACDASSRRACEPVDAELLRVGEAALCLDPLSSQGLQHALTSAYRAAIVANTWLRAPSQADAATALFSEQHDDAAERARVACAEFYARAAQCHGTPFWVARAGMPAPHQAESPAPRSPLPDPDACVGLASHVAFGRAAVIRDHLVEWGTVLSPADGRRPIGFVDGVPIAGLADILSSGAPAADVAHRLAAWIGPRRAARALAWLWGERLIEVVPAARAAHPPRATANDRLTRREFAIKEENASCR